MTHPLPPLPEPYHGFYAAPMYAAYQMRDYARAALADDAGLRAAVRLVCEATPGQLPMALDALRDHAAIAAAQPSAEPDLFPDAGKMVGPATSAWQSIETAPKDGRRILLHPAVEVADAWSKGHWSKDNKCWISGGDPMGFEPTHWMHLPSAPKEIK